MTRITVSTTINASINQVWECWTEPEHITNWNFASEDWCCPNAINDLTANKKFSWRMEAKNGSMGFDFEGIYDKIIENESISYKMMDGRKVDIKFNQHNNKVTVSETFDAEGSNSDEQQREGWQAILENFKKYVETKGT